MFKLMKNDISCEQIELFESSGLVGIYIAFIQSAYVRQAKLGLASNK